MVPKQVVLIEDDPDIQKLVKLSLSFTAGSEVTAVGDGATGLERARAQQPGLVLLDVGLPDTDGYSLIKLLKADPATREIPVIFLSARTQAAEIQKGLSLGAAGYLVKPFDPMQLATEIGRILHIHTNRPGS